MEVIQTGSKIPTFDDYLLAFPFPNIRPKQREVLQEICNAFNNGYRVIVLEAPTGFGESSCHVYSSRGNNTILKISLVGSGNLKTLNRFYRVLYDEDFDDFMCDCKAYGFGMTIPRRHMYTCAIYEKSNA